MKKQKIQFIVILIVLAVLVAATFGMKWYNKNKEEEKTAEEEASTIYISKVDVDTITAFSYEIDQVTYSFTKNGDTWTYDGDTSIDIDEDTVKNMLGTFSALTATDEIEYDDLSDGILLDRHGNYKHRKRKNNRKDHRCVYVVLSCNNGNCKLCRTGDSETDPSWKRRQL